MRFPAGNTSDGRSDEERCGGTPDDYDACRICGADMHRVACWSCLGEGGFHDCGDDTCCCLDKDEITEDCPECNGVGSYSECTALPHTESQMVAWAAKRKT